jgi:hypothetical protein
MARRTWKDMSDKQRIETLRDDTTELYQYAHAARTSLESLAAQLDGLKRTVREIGKAVEALEKKQEEA